MVQIVTLQIICFVSITFHCYVERKNNWIMPKLNEGGNNENNNIITIYGKRRN